MSDRSFSNHPDQQSDQKPDRSGSGEMGLTYESWIRRLYESYGRYREPVLSHRRFKHRDIVPLLEELGKEPGIELSEEGLSTEGRPIFRIRMGNGNIPVLLWSQMHGDEATATMALFDIFRFLKSRDEFDDLRTTILSKLVIHAIPMLNPDATERFQRNTPLGIDMNRDANRRQCPESQLLKRIRDQLNARFGFNLHDQSTLYSVGDTPKNTIIAFLAPAFDENRSVNRVREKSMKLIAGLFDMLEQFIPGHVAAYTDEYEPRAFGDLMQKWGTGTVLVESGGMKGDPEKQYIRKLNFLLLLEAFRSIATNDFESCPLDRYHAIPPNKFRLYDLILRNVMLASGDHEFMVDIGINRAEVNTDCATRYYERGEIMEVGDLSTLNGYEERDMGGLRGHPGMVYPGTFANVQEFEKMSIPDLLRQGHTAVRLAGLPESLYTDFPMNFVGDKSTQDHRHSRIAPESPANMILKDGEIAAYAVVNGNIVDIRPEADVDRQLKQVRNALVFH